MKAYGKEITIRSGAAEYLSYIASIGDQSISVELRYEDENDVLAAHQFIDGSMVYNESVKGNSFIIKNNKVYILDAQKKMLDPEVIDGVECIHYIAYANTAQAATIDGKPVPNTDNSDREVWEHPQWGIALQTLTGQSLKLNYRNIVPGPQPKEKFEIPAGYKETDMTDAFGALMKAMQNQ